MNETTSSDPAPPPARREEVFAALFANMVIQHSNMALMCLGQVPHPDSGEMVQDLESARMLIDQLEMLEAKTKGNLDQREESLLKKALSAVRMAFVETVEGGGEPAPAPVSSPSPAPLIRETAPTAPAPAAPKATVATVTVPAEDAESRKKFSKKY